ncbi:hypothetical protein [Alteromonas antoniana]|uniref:hypothetical protein n=1 Tax=Alteromonas antoniana TaxID=2803813 RepID=UPI001C440357|nr:hypothetical protein [Alteromonas antoniana]
MPKNKWTYDAIHKSALQHEHKNDWLKAEPRAYHAAHRRNIILEVTAHMSNPSRVWTISKCQAEASKYWTTKEWKDCHKPSYRAAKRYRWITVCKPFLKSNREKLSREMCLEIAKVYVSEREFRQHHLEVYEYAVENGIYPECRALITGEPVSQTKVAKPQSPDKKIQSFNEHLQQFALRSVNARI